MSQSNYFAYNILDTIYFNQPTGENLTSVYGIDSSFKRRNSQVFNEMTPEQQQEYIENENKFIQAVINKYVMDDFNEGSYIGISTGDNTYTYAYFKSPRSVGIELSDMLSNVNGVHNYKLLSAKDIDFDNVILPNSAILRDYNWGGFDENRRWGDKPIHINNTFELLNVIDYLLCACDNLWNELYKLKYNTNEIVQLWFTKDVTNTVLIYNTNKLVSQDFQIGSTGRSGETRMITYLDPTNYYTVLNNDPDNKFGIVTNFYKSTDDTNLIYDRKIIDVRNQNIILMTVLPISAEINEYATTMSQNIGGTLQQIYAYKIGDDLKIYPGPRVDTFINDKNIYTNSNQLVDFENQKLKFETFFKSSSETYSKLYIQFLNINNISLSGEDINSNIDFSSVNNLYILYYIDANDNNKKVIVTSNYENSDTPVALWSTINNTFTSLETYSIFNFYGVLLSDQVKIIDDQILPIFYMMDDEYFATLEVTTPNSVLFSSQSSIITIYYYKNNNKLDFTLSKEDYKNPGEYIEIEPEDDYLQNLSLLSSQQRYNVPDSTYTYFNFDATYIAYIKNGIEYNPLNLKLDDEYNDIMLYDYSHIIDDATAGQYYKYNAIDQNNNYKRGFEQFTYQSFNSNKNNYLSTDLIGKQYKHIWTKNENPYKLNVYIDGEELLNQSISKEEYNIEINKLKNNNELVQTSYNQYCLHHKLTDGIEEMKVNLKFYIDETSKVKYSECVVPLNINKIYQPTINYYSYIATLKERDSLYDIQYSYFQAGEIRYISLGDIYTKLFPKYGTVQSGQLYQSALNYIPDLYSYMTTTITYGSSEYQNFSLEDFYINETSYTMPNNSIFEFTYDNTRNLINLIGGYYNDLKFGLNKFANISLKKDGTPITLKVNNDNKRPYIFNINGLGQNYRLHGSNKSCDNNFRDGGTLNQLNQYQAQYDLISVSTLYNYGSINSQLQFKINDIDNGISYQLGYICNNSLNNWESNEDMSFNVGIDENNNTYHSYLIHTLPIDICKSTYMVSCNTIYNVSQQNEYKVTYYIPLSYIKINSSTFFPDPNQYGPKGLQYDLNDTSEENNDIIRYKNYISCWNTDNHYHPIELSLKLFDNISLANPYYYESNEATMKFNINRASVNGTPIGIGGRPNIIYVSVGSKYYLSDFIEMSHSDSIPTGSYLYFNEDYNMYDIKEIYGNSLFTNNQNPSHNSHYHYSEQFSYNGTNILKNMDSDSIDDNPLIPYPIFNSSIINENPEENETVEYSTTSYDYDIYRISDINKLNIESIQYQIITQDNNNALSSHTAISSETNSLDGITTNIDLFTIDIDNDNFLNNFDWVDNNTFNMIYYHVNSLNLYSSKNYYGSGFQNRGTNSKIAPIARVKRNNTIEIRNNSDVLLDSIDLSTINIYPSKGNYEFFEFKYSDIYVAKYTINNENNRVDWQFTPIFPGSFNDNSTIYTAYDKQLIEFLKTADPNSNEFLCNRTFMIEYLTQQNEENPDEENPQIN